MVRLVTGADPTGVQRTEPSVCFSTPRDWNREIQAREYIKKKNIFKIFLQNAMYFKKPKNQ